MLSSSVLRRPISLVVAVVIILASLVPLLMQQKASAAILGTRSIQMSTSAVSASSTTYTTTFRFGSTGNVQAIWLDFCSNSPIIGETTCTAPTGFASGTTVSNLSAGSGANISTFTTTAAKGNGVVISAASAVNMTNLSTDVSFDLTAVTNPSTTGTFYARVYTYATTANATAANVGNGGGTYVDAGGFALSTAAQITVTAKVQERLVFCVYTTGSGNNCTTKSGTAVALGDTNGVLDPTGPYVDKNAKFSITTNASGNAIVRMKGATLTSGGNTITAVGGTPAVSALGTEQFGLCVYESAGSGLTEDTVYDGGLGTECASTTQTAGTGSTGGAGTADYAFDTASTSTTYGDVLATKAAGDYSTGILAMIGNIGNSTEAGIYTTTLTFIATGTY